MWFDSGQLHFKCIKNIIKSIKSRLELFFKFRENEVQISISNTGW